MKSEITTDQIRFYQDNGYLLIEGLLSSSELDYWRVVVDEAVEQQVSNKSLANPDDYYAKVFKQCIQLARTHFGVKEIIYDRRLGEMAAKLANVYGLRMWHDQALIKPPFGNPTAWHLDNPYWSFNSRDAISLWVALDDATNGNGCMWYLPGTHKTARFDNVGIGSNIADLFKVYPEWRLIESVAVPCLAGSAIFHNGLLAHGAGANMTRGQRRAMTCGYMPDGSTFNGVKNVLPDDYFESLTIGDILNDESINPLIWSSRLL